MGPWVQGLEELAGGGDWHKILGAYGADDY